MGGGGGGGGWGVGGRNCENEKNIDQSKNRT